MLYKICIIQPISCRNKWALLGLRHAEYIEVGNGAGFGSSPALFWLLLQRVQEQPCVQSLLSVQRVLTGDAGSRYWCKELINGETLMWGFFIHNVLFIYGMLIPTTEIMKS